MKKIKNNSGEYVSPLSTPLDALFEGTLCTSTLTDGQLEGFGTTDEFTGWGN